MIIAFIIWTIAALIFIVIGISTWNAKEAAGFFSGVKPPKIPEKNIKKYNHAVAGIWFVYSAFFEVLGIPFLFLEQNSPYFILMVLAVPFLVIGIIVTYLFTEKRYIKE